MTNTSQAILRASNSQQLNALDKKISGYPIPEKNRLRYFEQVQARRAMLRSPSRKVKQPA